ASALTLGSDGNFYGTTGEGGNGGKGTVFQMTTNGTLNTLVDFDRYNGAGPNALALGSDGNFYGTTLGGGNSGDGTVFKVTTNGTLTTLATFNFNNGEWPNALALGNDGNFYSTTDIGGLTNSTYTSGMGTVFKVTTNGTLTTLNSFTGEADGANPGAGLTLGADGNFYGTAGDDYYGADKAGDGTVFKVTTNGTLTPLATFNFN